MVRAGYKPKNEPTALVRVHTPLRQGYAAVNLIYKYSEEGPGDKDNCVAQWIRRLTLHARVGCSNLIQVITIWFLLLCFMFWLIAFYCIAANTI